MRLWASPLLLALCALPASAACVTPILDFQFPDKPVCKVHVEDPDCAVLPPQGESLTFTGELVWQWDTQGCGLEQLGAPEDQPIQLRGVGTNPAWVGLTIDPDRFVVTVAEQTHPDNLQPQQDGTLRGEVRKAVAIAMAATRAPAGEELQELEESGGYETVTVLAQAEANDMYTASFGSEFFRIDARGFLEEPQREAPALPPLAALLALASAAFALRRRA